MVGLMTIHALDWAKGRVVQLLDSDLKHYLCWMEESQLRTGTRRRVRALGLGGSFSGSVG